MTDSQIPSGDFRIFVQKIAMQGIQNVQQDMIAKLIHAGSTKKTKFIDDICGMLEGLRHGVLAARNLHRVRNTNLPTTIYLRQATDTEFNTPRAHLVDMPEACRKQNCPLVAIWQEYFRPRIRL